MMGLTTWVAVQPPSWALQIYLALGWAVIASAGAALAAYYYVQRREDQRCERFGYQRKSGRDVMAAAAAMGALAGLVPGPWGLLYWLGLAFQMPAMVSVLLCGWYLKRLLYVPRPPKAAHARLKPPPPRVVIPVPLPLGMLVGAVAASALGWLLLLDTVLAMPLCLYQAGFAPWMPVLLLGAIGLPWVLRTALPARHPLPWFVAVALLVGTLLRLPNGNAWDAVLDPWLWVAAQVFVWRWLRDRLRPRKPAAPASTRPPR